MSSAQFVRSFLCMLGRMIPSLQEGLVGDGMEEEEEEEEAQKTEEEDDDDGDDDGSNEEGLHKGWPVAQRLSGGCAN
jgi:hypothetical protein